MLSMQSQRVNVTLDLVVAEVCGAVSARVWGGGEAVGQGRAQPFSSQLPAPRWVCRTKPRCRSHCLTACWRFLLFFLLLCDNEFIQGSMNNKREGNKNPQSKNKAKQEGAKHKLARAKGLALISLLTSVFIQRLWIQVNFLCSVFIAMLLVLNWNNENFVDWVKRLSHFIQSPASLSVSAGFKQFILISDF